MRCCITITPRLHRRRHSASGFHAGVWYFARLTVMLISVSDKRAYQHIVTRQNRVPDQTYRNDGVTCRRRRYPIRTARSSSMRLQLEDLTTAQAHFTFARRPAVNRIVFQLGAEEATQHGDVITQSADRLIASSVR